MLKEGDAYVSHSILTINTGESKKIYQKYQPEDQESSSFVGLVNTSSIQTTKPTLVF
jgi:hypothetical protein